MVGRRSNPRTRGEKKGKSGEYQAEKALKKKKNAAAALGNNAKQQKNRKKKGVLPGGEKRVAKGKSNLEEKSQYGKRRTNQKSAG